MRQATRLFKASLAAGIGAAAVGVTCQETVPFGAEGWRRRPLATGWVAPWLMQQVPITGDGLAQYMDPKMAGHLKEQWPAGSAIPIPEAGRVVVRWCPEAVAALSEEQRLGVQEGISRAVAATGAIITDTGFGRHALGSGWHLEMIPSNEFMCATAGHVIVLSTGAVQACWSRSREDPQSALLFMLSHELAHRMALHQGEDYLSRWRQTAVRLQHIASAAAGAARREPSPDRMRAAVIASDTAVRLQLAQETRCLRWQHEWEADAIACAALARAGVPAERWADVARVLGWRPKRELKVGRLQLTLLSDADPATEADLRRLAAAILKLAGVMRRVGRASEADALLLRHTSCPETEQLWLWGLPPADREAILLQLMQTHPPLEQRRERILRLAARHELREAEQARG